jgi:hypothetical protein
LRSTSPVGHEESLALLYCNLSKAKKLTLLNAVRGLIVGAIAIEINGTEGTRLTALPLSHAWTRSWPAPGTVSLAPAGPNGEYFG